LEEAEELERIDIRRASSARLLTLALVLLLALVAFFAVRFGPWSQRHEVATTAGHPASAGAAATAPEMPQPVAASAAPARAPREGQAQAAPNSDPASSTRYTISVGTFLERDRANVERRKLLNVTPYASRVLRFSERGAESYRVVVGTFESRAEAEKAASDLMGTGQVREAMVLPAAGAAAN
jgi:cell division protein FtsN